MYFPAGKKEPYLFLGAYVAGFIKMFNTWRHQNETIYRYTIILLYPFE